jgi:hypothetical protein
MTIIVYLLIGITMSVILWKTMKIDWKHETNGTKILLLACPLFWPICLAFILYALLT